jgi:hypothetical protein
MAKKKAKLDVASKTLLDGIIAELRIAIPTSYNALAREFPDICGFAIATTAYIEFVVPIFQRRRELDEDDPFDDKRFWPPEWAATNDKSRRDSFGKSVDQARIKLCEHCESMDVDPSCNVRVTFLDMLLDLLVELDAAAKLGSKTDERYLTIWLAGDDEGPVLEASKKLNTKKMHKFAKEALSF